MRRERRALFPLVNIDRWRVKVVGLEIGDIFRHRAFRVGQFFSGTLADK
jgi:hypothetical protein